MGSKSRERAFRRSLESLGEIFAFTAECFSEWNIPPEARSTVDLVVEELFTNCVKYNRKTTKDIVIGLELRDREIAVSLTDFDGGAFDLLERPPVDIGKPIEKRKPGGLGIHLVKKLVDRIEQENTSGKNKITFFKQLE